MSKEEKIKACEWQVDDCERYIEELLTKEESGKIKSDYARSKLKTTREDLKYYRDKLNKLLE